MRTLIIIAAAILSLGAFATPATAQSIDPKVQARIDRILKATPLIDGHNDLPEQLVENYGSRVDRLASGTAAWTPKPLMTDIARLRAGRVGGQFWSVYISGTVTGDEAIRQTIEQIDIVDRLIAAYPRDLECAFTADDIVRIHKAGRVASLIGIEGGRQIGGSLPSLRQFYRLGAFLWFCKIIEEVSTGKFLACHSRNTGQGLVHIRDFPFRIDGNQRIKAGFYQASGILRFLHFARFYVICFSSHFNLLMVDYPIHQSVFASSHNCLK
ncbi:MAG: membrane dipeptidase [Cyclobacteriaceae bacterium]